MGSWLIVAVPPAAAAVLLVRARFWPYAACRACQGRRGRGVGSTPRAFNRCRWCGGTGERIRPLAKIYPRWREEARKR